MVPLRRLTPPRRNTEPASQSRTATFGRCCPTSFRRCLEPGPLVGATLEAITIAPTDTVTDTVQRWSIRRSQVTSRRAAMVTAVAVAAGAVVLDIVTKTIAVEVVAAGPAHVGTLHLRLVANRGILMGMIALPIWLITLVTVVVVAVAATNSTRRTSCFSYRRSETQSV